MHVIAAALSPPCHIRVFCLWLICWCSEDKVYLVRGQNRSGATTFRDVLQWQVQCFDPSCRRYDKIQPVRAGATIAPHCYTLVSGHTFR